MTESAPPQRKGFYGSFPQLGVPAGVVLANLIFLVMTATVAPDAFQAWGWRVPFIISVVLMGLGLYVQIRLEDTPEFKALEAADIRFNSPLSLLDWWQSRQCCTSSGAT